MIELSLEQDLLVASCAPAVSEPLSLPDPSALRWDSLLADARWHRMSPLLWRRLGPAVAQGAEVPVRVAEALRSEVRDNSAKSLIHERFMGELLSELDRAGIPVMLLKGAALVEAVYRDPALRPMDDVDLLVRAADIREAQHLVESLGYKVSGASLGRDDEARLASNFHHYPLIHPSGGLAVEIHHHLTSTTAAFDISGYWDRAVPSGSGSHLLPAPEDLFLHVAIHFTEDRIARRRYALGQLADLSWIAHRWDLDWTELARRADSYGESERLFLALEMMRCLRLGGPPAEVVMSLQPGGYQPRMGDRFLQHRVLRSRPSVAVEEFVRGNRRLLSGDTGLEWFVRPGEPVPSRTRLRLRQAAYRIGKIRAMAPSPGQVVDDLILSRWILGLRDGRSKRG